MLEKPKSEWDLKYFRETPFMPFGSMMNAYAQLNCGEKTEVKQFLSDARKIYRVAKSFVKDAYEFSLDTDKPEVLEPITAEQAMKTVKDFQDKMNKLSQVEEIKVEGEQVKEIQQ